MISARACFSGLSAVLLAAVLAVLLAPPAAATTVYRYVDSAGDDTDSTSLSTGDSDLDEGLYDCGIIFRNLPVNPGDTVTSATLYVYAEETWASFTESTIGTMRGLTPPGSSMTYVPFSTANLVGRSVTGTPTTYTLDSTAAVGGYDLLTITTLIQDLVNHPNYNHEIGLLMYKATSGPNRPIATVEDAAVDPPRLFINYDPTCLTLAPVPNGVVSPAGKVDAYTSVTITCNTGYIPAGSTSRQCLSTSAYDGTDTACGLDPTFCPTLTAVNGDVGVCGRTLGTACTATCNSGYVPKTGSSTRTCQSSAAWSGTTYECTNSVCPALSLTNGAVSYSDPSRIYSTTATHSCNVGYSLSGSVTRTCNNDLGGGVAAWSLTAPTCVILDCGTLTQPAPENGGKSCTGTTYGETCTLSCDAGYDLFGTAVRTCGPAGLWLGAADALCSTVAANMTDIALITGPTLTAGDTWSFSAVTRDLDLLVVNTGSDVITLHSSPNGGAPTLATANYTGAAGTYHTHYAIAPVTGSFDFFFRVNGDLVSPTPMTITIVSALGAGATSTVVGSGTTASTVGVTTTLALTLADVYGNARDGAGGSDVIVAELASSAVTVAVDVVLDSPASGTLTYVASRGGIYTLTVTVNGGGAVGSPWAVLIDSACPPGFKAVDQVSCAECPANTYSTSVNAEVCSACVASRVAPETSPSPLNCTCAVGRWLGFADAGADTGLTPCPPCPVGGVCAGGSALPVASPGYQATDTTGSFVVCPNRLACVGGDGCRTGYKGRLCADCVSGYYRLGNECRKCSKANLLVVPLMLLLAFGLTSGLLWLNTRETRVYGWAALVIATNSFQIVAIYAELTLGWNSVATAVFRVLSVLNFNLDLSSPECSISVGNPFVFKYFVTLCLPIIFLGLFAIDYAIAMAYAAWVRSSGPAWAAAHPSASARMTKFRTETHVTGPYLRAAVARAFLQSLLILYLPLVAQVLRFFDCQEVERGVHVLTAAPAHQCYTGTWYGVLPFAILFALVYCVALPGGVMALLFLRRRALPWDEVVIRYGFLVARFNDETFWFEGAIMVRKLVVVVCVVAFSHPFTKAAAAALALLLAGFHASYLAPYRRSFHNKLESVSICCAFVVLSTQTASWDATFRDIVVITFLFALIIVLVGGTVWDAIVVLREDAAESEAWEKSADSVAGFEHAATNEFEVATGAGSVELLHMGVSDDGSSPPTSLMSHTSVTDLGSMPSAQVSSLNATDVAAIAPPPPPPSTQLSSLATADVTTIAPPPLPPAHPEPLHLEHDLPPPPSAVFLASVDNSQHSVV